MPNYNAKTDHLPKQAAKWQHLPTTVFRHPQLFKPEIQAIAEWADRQDNPVESLQRLLAIAQQLEQN